MSDLRFDGQVVLITGAGQGLGRIYALEFGKRGASVVVNDLGSTPGGIGKTSKVADTVVEEIRKNGGVAVANYDSVEFGDKLVKTALDNFGRIDIVINNAGILRDRTFQRMTEEEWDIIHKIHVKGAFSVTKAAWNVMRQQKFGRIIMTSSPSGVYGNFGQTNYSSAKLALLGFANTLALEGRKHNILVNTIAPTAYTRLTKSLMPPDSEKEMKPEFIMPLVVYLCHSSYTETGGLFELCGGHVCKLRWQRTKGALLREVGKEMKPEDIRDNWNAIVNWDEPEIVESIGESTMKTGEAISKILSGENDLASTHPIKPNLAKKHVFEPQTTSHTEIDIILYALGIGASTTQEDHLKFLFEMNEDFSVIPSFGVIPPFRCMASIGEAEGLSINPTQILHGEQYLELYKPIPVRGKLTSKSKISEVLDKGSGALIITEVDTFDEKDEKIFSNQFVTFVVGSGGFRGKRSSDVLKPVVKPPKRVHDAEMEEKTNVDQAALYRLSGDHNPLHIDPAFAAMGGFKQPILHGLCSFGYATRHVMKTFAGNDPKRIKAIKVRFSKPVLPGQTLRTTMWKEGNRVHFETYVKETGTACLTGAYIDLNPPQNLLASDEVIGDFSKQLTETMVRRVGAIIQWDITKSGEVAKSWEMNLSKGSGFIREGVAAHPGLTITVSDDNALEIFTGKLDPQKAHADGKMSLNGVEPLIRKLNVIFGAAARL